VTGNKGKEGMTDNIYLKKDAVITVTGALTGSSIGVTLEEIQAPSPAATTPITATLIPQHSSLPI
jgi:hypothetical protein